MRYGIIAWLGALALACTGADKGEPVRADGGAGDSALPAPTGPCVDIRVTVGALPEPKLWFNQVRVIPGGVWRDDSGLHVLWGADRTDGGPNISRQWLIASSYDPVTGEVIRHREFDVFPAQAYGFDHSALRAAAGALDDSGKFCAVGAWSSSSTGLSPNLAFIGNIAAAGGKASLDSTTELPLGEPTIQPLPTAVTWDGETFAVQALGGDTSGALWASRISTAGEVTLAFVRVGTTPNNALGPLGHKTKTDPSTGRTYTFDSSYENYLNAHERDGGVVPGSPFTIHPVGLVETVASNPRLSVAPNNVWVGWQQSALEDPFALVVQRLKPNGFTNGQAVQHPVFFDGEEFGVHTIALIARKAGVGIVTASRRGIYIADFASEVLGSPRLLVDSVNQADPGLQVNYVDAIAWHEEEWLIAEEYRSGFPANVLHIVRTDTGCTYPSATLP